MSVFRFQHFSVVNDRSAMKVNTDGVLLGAAMTVLPQDRMMLDVGTGTGTIALMAAQRSVAEGCRNVHIDAIDIDEPSAVEAAENFRNSPWPDILQAHRYSLEDFSRALPSDSRYDLVFSNPPYFEKSLQAPQERRNAARHTAGLSYRELLEFCAERLSENGRFAVVLPSDQENELLRYARMNGLHLFRMTRVRTVPRKQPQRIIAEFARARCERPEEHLLTIQNEGQYTQEYLSLTKDFYLFSAGLSL